jgi:hypothetical protein
MHSSSNPSISADSSSRSGSHSWASLAWSSQKSAVRFQKSGTVILSGNLSGSASVSNSSVAAENQPVKFAPLVGYLPPTLGFIPAENETWLEVDRLSKTVILYKGKTKMKEMHGEGSVSIDAGEYFIQQKQKHPLWYATDDYFSRRKLSVPSKEDRLRYRRGAYGPFAIFPSTNFPIHSGPVWSSDVGGLRISKGDLSSIYYELPVGAPVVVK